MKVFFILALMLTLFSVSLCETKKMCRMCKLGVEGAGLELLFKEPEVLKKDLKNGVCKTMAELKPICADMDSILKQMKGGASSETICKQYKFC
ncbi:hypothetical protein COOONC_21035 [Cooperia oncophora]